MAAQFQCLRRALRSGAIDGELHELLKRVVDDAAVKRIIHNELPSARRRCEGEWEGVAADLSPELLRIASFAGHSRGNVAAAIADQRRAAECYARLEKSSHPSRRGADAEWDAFFRLASMIYEADRAAWPDAFEAIVQAERFAVLGVRHEKVARPDRSAGFVIGEAMPMEFPPRLVPLWRLSALLHLAVGDFHYPEIRAALTLPPERWDMATLRAQVARLAREAQRDLSVLPAENRPAGFARLPAVAEHFEQAAREAGRSEDRRAPIR